MFKLHVEEGEQKGEEFALQEGDNLLGRSREAQIKLRSSDVSSRHARLSVQGQNVFVANISQYGTWVGERKLRGDESLRLEVGQLIRAGNNSLRLQHIVQMPPRGLPARTNRGRFTRKNCPNVPKPRLRRKLLLLVCPSRTLEKPLREPTRRFLNKPICPRAQKSQRTYDKLMRAKAELADLEETDEESSADKTTYAKDGFCSKRGAGKAFGGGTKKRRQHLALICRGCQFSF